MSLADGCSISCRGKQSAIPLGVVYERPVAHKKVCGVRTFTCHREWAGKSVGARHNRCSTTVSKYSALLSDTRRHDRSASVVPHPIFSWSHSTVYTWSHSTVCTFRNRCSSRTSRWHRRGICKCMVKFSMHRDATNGNTHGSVLASAGLPVESQ